MRAGWLAAMFAAVLTQGCGASGSSGNGLEVDGGGTADPEAVLGGFVVDLVAARGSTPAYTAVLGKVYAGAMPSTVIWTPAHEESGCRLLTPRVPFCSPGCGGSAACVDDGRCQAYPAAQNLGRVHVEGLGVSAFDMDPISGSYQPPAAVKLPYPPCPEGAAVTMTTAGGVLPSFALASHGITPVAVEGPFALASGEALPVVWSPPGDAAKTRVEVKLDISHHGGSKGKIECNVPDTGLLSIPASQITQLLSLGVAGFPTIVITRVGSGTTALPQGKVSLRMTSSLELPVEIPGLRSCTGNNECLSGQTCRSDLTCG